MAAQPTPPKSGMTLYANLLDPSDTTTPGTISRAPVVFKNVTDGDTSQEDAASKKQQISAASLRFQPTKRPQLSQKPKTKPTIPKTTVIPGSTSTATGPAPPATKTRLEDWTGDDDDVNGFYGVEKRQRGGRKKRKKNREAATVTQNWDDIYDPSRPNSYDAYKHSDEMIREIREWKDRLYAHRMARRRSSDTESEDDYVRRPMNRLFAPPSQFAPPPNLNDLPPENSEPRSPERQYVPEPSVTIPDDATGEDAYARRLRMSQNIAQAPLMEARQPSPPPPPPPQAPEETLPLPPSAPDQVYAAATISRPPVRYMLPPAPEEIPATEAELEARFANEIPDAENSTEDAPRSSRPGQPGFAERFMKKYGWTKGSGLGASGSGIVKPLQVKIEKQKKKPDAEGGGFVTPGGRGRIVGPKQNHSEEGKFGPMSEVIILHGMVDGLDLDAELSSEDGGLLQEIGDECTEKYGRVERVFIDRDCEGQVPVFVKFTSQLSALRAVNALEGRIFNGNTITARFYDADKFEKGIYRD
ncbi:hypothetical protein VTO42DRAFT_8811 [Malbranchea cinnamomea]